MCVYLCSTLICVGGWVWFLGNVLVYEERKHVLVYMKAYVVYGQLFLGPHTDHGCEHGCI